MYGYVLIPSPEKIVRGYKNLNRLSLHNGEKAVNYVPCLHSLLENERRIVAAFITVRLIVIMFICGISHSCVSCFVPALFYFIFPSTIIDSLFDF